MNTNFQITTQTFKQLHEPLQKLPRTCLFTELYKTKDNKITKKKIFQTKKAWLTWKESITRELIHQRTLSAMYPGKVLTILNYTVETTNHQRNLYITYDCGDDVEPLFQYLNNNSVSFQEQTQIFEQLLQITCILYKSQFEHTNLKPNNILYTNKQVLITDFGSARTNYQNFLKQYSSSAEKDWQNNLIFFYPQEYQFIMTEDNVDFREESWEKLKAEMSNKTFRKRIDIWALSMMMMQVFENNQILPNKLTNYYGLNNELLLQKIEKLKQFSAGIYSEVIQSLVIEKKEPEQVYQKFIKQKQMLKRESSSMESTFTIKQIFDLEPDDNYFPSYKPENYFLDKKEIKQIEEQYDDDASSVISSNYQIDVIGFTENKPNNLTQVPNLLPPVRSQGGIGRQKPQTQKYDVAQNDQRIFGFQDKDAPPGEPNKRRTIMVTNYDILQQQNQGSSFQEPQPINGGVPLYPIQSEMYRNKENPNQFSLKKVEDKPATGGGGTSGKIDPNVQLELNNNNSLNPLQIISLADNFNENDGEISSPGFEQNQTSTFQFQQAQKLDTFKEKGTPQRVGGGDFINTFENFQFAGLQPENLLQFEDPDIDPNNTGRFIGTQNQLQPNKKFIDLLEIDDLNGQVPNPPIQNQPYQEIFKPDQQESNLIKIEPSKQYSPSQIVPQKGSLIILNANQNQIPIMEIRDKSEITKPTVPIVQQDDYENLNNEDFKLIQISENDDNDFLDGGKRTSLIQFGKNDRQFQPVSQIDDPIQQKPDNVKIPTNPYSLDVIKKILQEGVTQLQDPEQSGVTEKLKQVQKVLAKVVQHITDPDEIFDNDDLQPEEKIQVQQFLVEINKQNEKDMLKLIEDVNETVEIIEQKQKVVQNIDNKEIEKNPLLLNLLNEDELKRVKERNQGNKILTEQIDKLLEVKDDLKKFKQNPNMQNLLKKQQLDLLNKEELKIYQRLLEIMPKDKRQGDKILIQQREIQRRLDELQKQEKEEAIKKRFAAFLLDPQYDKLLSNNELMQLTDDEKKKYQAALEDLLLKVPQRQKKSIQQQIDLLKKDNKKKHESKKIEISILERQKNPQNEQQFQDAYMHVMKELGEEEDGEVLSKNKYIRGFQQNKTISQITDIIPDDCQQYQQQSKNRKTKYYDFKGQKYKGQTLNDMPDGLGILRKEGVSSIYKGIFKEGKFYWGQVLEMNDEGLLTEYVGYYHLQHNVKHGKARLKWYQPQREGFCGDYQFSDHDQYVGHFVLGYIHGKGKKIYKDQSEYEGDWKKNKREGQGRYTLKKKGQKTITYEGEFQNDFQHGQDIKAIHHHQTGLDLVVQGKYRNGKPVGQHQLIFNNQPQRYIDY